LALIAKIENKGQSPKDLKSRFKDKDGKRLHVAEELRKPKPKKEKSKAQFKIKSVHKKKKRA